MEFGSSAKVGSFELRRGKAAVFAAVTAFGGIVSFGSSALADDLEQAPYASQSLISLVGGSGGVTSNAVSAGSIFSVAVVGFNGTTSTASGAYLTTPSTFAPAFGTTSTYAGDALGGQTLTITSAESVVGSNTVDTITVSVPTNFAPTGTKIGTRYVAAIDLDIGEYNAYDPTTGTTYDPLTFSSPITLSTPAALNGSGYILYGASAPYTEFALGPGGTLSDGGLQYAAAEGVSDGTGASQSSSIEGIDVNTISFSLTYPTPAVVPEPASLAILGIAAAALLGRRRRTV